MSIAREIAARFQWDGARREDDDGKLLVHVLRGKAVTVARHPIDTDIERFEFKDGSAIIDADVRWDIADDHCESFCMMSEGCSCHA